MGCQYPGTVWKVEDLLATIKVEGEAREARNLTRASASRPTYCHGEYYPSLCTSVKNVKEGQAIFKPMLQLFETSSPCQGVQFT